MEGILRSDPPMSAQSEGWKTGVYLSTPMPGEMACQPKPRRLERSAPSLKLRRAAFARRGAEGEGWNPLLELHHYAEFRIMVQLQYGIPFRGHRFSQLSI